jgi:hypothetical protein
MVGKEPEDDQVRRAPGSDPAPETDPDLEDRKPLYRDEVAGDHTTGGARGGGESEQGTRVTPAVGGDASPSEDATTILPRTERAGYATSRSDFDPDDDEDLGDPGSERGPIGARSKLALLVAGVAAVVIVGLAIGYAVLNIGDPSSSTPPPAGSVPGSTTGTGSLSPDPNVLLSDATMLSARQARGLDKGRTWKVAVTQRGVDADSPQPACLGAEAVQGQPPSQQTVLRLLSSTGKKAPGVLHQADAYASVEEAARAYAVATKALGGCPLTGAYVASGHVVSGVGDQAVGEVLNVTTGNKTEYRSVVLNRTGRVVNVLDVAQPDRALPIERVAGALAAVTDTECKTSEGRCAGTVKVAPGPPPVGGDQRGFLAPADLPPVGKTTTSWAGTVPSLPDADFTGSGCETVNWAKAEAQKRAARTYLLQDVSLTFGLDNIVLTGRDAKAAGDLVQQVKADLDSCAKRKLTATVSKPQKVSATGVRNAPIAGWTATVSQKTTAGTAKYRVGIVSAGNKAVFTFLNPQKNLDLTDAQWDTVAVRAGERATQQR